MYNPFTRRILDNFFCIEVFSRELSKKINNSNRRRQQSGTSIITNGKLWGYNQKDGELTINEDEAKVVPPIFNHFVNKYIPISSIKMKVFARKYHND